MQMKQFAGNSDFLVELQTQDKAEVYKLNVNDEIMC